VRNYRALNSLLHKKILAVAVDAKLAAVVVVVKKPLTEKKGRS
jgi:hypothetical protein